LQTYKSVAAVRTKKIVDAVANLQNWTFAILHISSRSKFSYFGQPHVYGGTELCLLPKRPGFDPWAISLTFGHRESKVPQFF
jgi:hypothetical protein